MSFRILAIRPLEGTSSSLLKSLNINCLYSFCNEYEFFNSSDQNLGGNPSDEVQDTEISKVLYNNKVPHDFYGANYSISAVVGKNGSGKSSLLELYYYFTLILSEYNGVITLKDISKEETVNCEVYFQEYDDQIKQVRIRKIVLKSSYSPTPHYLNEETAVIYLKSYKDKEKVSFVPTPNSELSVYNCVINYSLYGLNSVTMRWVQDIFYKNDGYQTPIVINPFRIEGNIDVNKEYLLAQARKILYVYVLKQSVFLSNIYLHEFAVTVDFDDRQYVNNDKDRLLVLDGIENFLSSISGSNVGQGEYLKQILNDLFSIIDFENSEEVEELVLTVETVSRSEGRKLYRKDFETDDIQEKRRLVKYLSLLYVFKKLQKIAENYRPYNKYQFLFNYKLSSGLIWNLDNSFSAEIIYPQIKDDLLNGNIESRKDIISKIVKLYAAEVADRNSTTVIGTHFATLITEFVTENITDLVFDVDKNLNASFEFDDNAEWLDITLKFENSSFFNYVTDTVAYTLRNIVEAQYRYSCFKEYLRDIKEDKSHVIFKLKQALNYFKIQLFAGLIFHKEGVNNFSFRLDIPERFFTGSEGIADVPIAFFKYDIKVVKTTQSDPAERERLVKEGKLVPYPFNRLSSGEQQSVHTVLNVVYHTYNLLSVRKTDDNKKYTNVSIIFDELELYLHPEYQRTFIKNILTVLNIFNEKDFEHYQEDLKFSILLSTHSPFILSDIPSENILKLEDGQTVKHDKINSFGSNIHDLLADEFFLREGFMGEFAAEKINRLFKEIKKYDENKKFLTKEQYLIYEKEVKLIGEKVLREPLLNLLDKLMMKTPDNKEVLIKKYTEILERLKEN